MRRVIAIGCLVACAGVVVAALGSGRPSTPSRLAARVVGAVPVPVPGIVPPGGRFFPPARVVPAPRGNFFAPAPGGPPARVTPPADNGIACPVAGCGGKPCTMLIEAGSQVAVASVASAPPSPNPAIGVPMPGGGVVQVPVPRLRPPASVPVPSASAAPMPGCRQAPKTLPAVAYAGR